MIGLGSLGAPVALDLARSGVGNIVLVDPEQLDIANISRHPCGYLSYVGKFKTDIIGNSILDINPAAEVLRHRLHVDWGNAEQIRHLIKNTDMVILTADSISVKSVINKICWEENTPLIWSGCFRRAYGGQILKVVPGQTACYECFRENIPDNGDHEVTSTRSANAPAYSDIDLKAEPGLSVDIAPISTMTSKLVIQHLLQGRESTLRSLDDDLDCNYYLFFNRREALAEQFAAMSDKIGEWTILRWYGIKMPRFDGCFCCGDPTPESVLIRCSKQMELLHKRYSTVIGDNHNV
ncbi:MAG: ThiF family adenylyltransferase [Planctomycetes bacterium]|nr:ThiF family adenylyltransferase [Planctomycetota bacterium]